MYSESVSLWVSSASPWVCESTSPWVQELAEYIRPTDSVEQPTIHSVPSSSGCSGSTLSLSGSAAHHKFCGCFSPPTLYCCARLCYYPTSSTLLHFTVPCRLTTWWSLVASGITTFFLFFERLQLMIELCCFSVWTLLRVAIACWPSTFGPSCKKCIIGPVYYIVYLRLWHWGPPKIKPNRNTVIWDGANFATIECIDANKLLFITYRSIKLCFSIQTDQNLGNWHTDGLTHKNTHTHNSGTLRNDHFPWNFEAVLTHLRKVTLTLPCESRILGSRAAVSVTIMKHVPASQCSLTQTKTNSDWANHSGSMLLIF